MAREVSLGPAGGLGGVVGPSQRPRSCWPSGRTGRGCEALQEGREMS